MNSKITKLYTFGCSWTKDNYQETWANLCAQEYGLELSNFAERGAGASFVVNRILTTKIDPTDTVIAIMWPTADRFDLWADQTTPHLLQDKQYASWPDGTGPKFVDYYGNHSDSKGFNLSGEWPRGYKRHYYKYFYSAQQAVHSWYTNIIMDQVCHVIGFSFVLSVILVVGRI
jgi:hypothetical protein